jgi:quinol monooxygenase YgiN
MIFSTVRLAISERDQAEVFRTLRVFQGHSSAKAGCAGVSVSRDVSDPEAVTIAERWETRGDFVEHVRSAEYRLLLAVIDLSVTPPEISFDDVEHIGGLDLVAELRSSQADGHPIQSDMHPPKE